MYLPGGPTIFCDSRSWVWLTLDDEDPTDVNKGLLKDTKLGQWELPNAIGAWYYQGRFIPEEEKSDVFPLCADDNQASASMKLDAIQICFDGHATAAVTPPNNLGGGESLALIRDNLAFLLVHEFAHWYSTNQLDVKATDGELILVPLPNYLRAY